jgi:hypothetical protein
MIFIVKDEHNEMRDRVCLVLIEPTTRMGDLIRAAIPRRPSPSTS